MKILMLYNPRCGSNGICSYFLKQNPNYEYFNQPFSNSTENGIRLSTYDNCLNYENVLVKSHIGIFDIVRMDKNKQFKDFNKDFDKIVLISRKNKTKQAISNIIALYHTGFLDNSIRPYYVGNIPQELINHTISQLEQLEVQLELYCIVSIKSPTTAAMLRSTPRRHACWPAL